jgi:16S rRNA G966 N2-methylase RsmD
MLPERVECVYIDPPYNIGNEGLSYNNNVNSSERWGMPKVVEDRKIGQVWTELSDALCRFVKVSM